MTSRIYILCKGNIYFFLLHPYFFLVYFIQDIKRVDFAFTTLPPKFTNKIKQKAWLIYK